MTSPFPTAFQFILPEASDNLFDRVSKLELRFGGQTTTGPFLSLTGGTVTGDVTVTGILTVGQHAEIGGLFVHAVDNITNAAPVGLQLYHETLVGTPAVGDGVSFDYQMDSATVKRQVGARWINSWTVAADATRTAQLRLFLPNAGTLSQVLAISPTTLGFFGVAAVARPLVPTGSTTDAVITALQNLGLFRQS